MGLLAGRLHVLDCALDGLAAGDPYELFLAVGSQEADPSFADRIAKMDDGRIVEVVTPAQLQ